MSQRASEQYFVLAALWLMMFSASAQVIIVSPILPELGEALNIPESLQGTLITSYTVMLGIMALVIGPISDKVGRRRILLLGTTSMAVALYLHALADSYTSMLAVRALAGVAGGMLSGAAVAYVGDYFPYERRGWANGIVVSGIAVGQIIGIPVGKLLADGFGVKWPFLMFAITMTFASLLVWFGVPQPDVRRDTQKLSFGRAARNYGALLKDPVVVAASAVYCLMFLSIGIYVIYLPTWLENVVGVSEMQIASLFFVGGLANVVAGPLAGRVSDTTGRKPLIVSSCIGFGAVMLATPFVIKGVWTAYAVFALAMVMVAMRISPLQSLMTAIVPAERRGSLMALAIAIGQVGMGLGSAVAGPSYTRYGYVSNCLLGAVAIIAMAILVQRALPEPDEAAARQTVPVD